MKIIKENAPREIKHDCLHCFILDQIGDFAKIRRNDKLEIGETMSAMVHVIADILEMHPEAKLHVEFAFIEEMRKRGFNWKRENGDLN